MEYKTEIRAWRWLFIIEGAITVAIGILAIFILPYYPKTTNWLIERQRQIAESRLALGIGTDQGDDEIAFQGLKLALMDPKVWLLGVAFHTTIMVLSVSLLQASL
jgi:threonine/homoserine/homoserine lactone efflux protein